MQKRLTPYDITKKLIGEIEPFGDSSVDEFRLENIHDMYELVEDLTWDLIKTSRFEDRQEESIKVMGHLAKAYLKDLHVLLNKEFPRERTAAQESLYRIAAIMSSYESSDKYTDGEVLTHIDIELNQYYGKNELD